jgi:hypothetical protein
MREKDLEENTLVYRITLPYNILAVTEENHDIIY